MPSEWKASDNTQIKSRSWETIAQELSHEMDSVRILELVKELDEALLAHEIKAEPQCDP